MRSITVRSLLVLLIAAAAGSISACKGGDQTKSAPSADADIKLGAPSPEAIFQNLDAALLAKDAQAARTVFASALWVAEIDSGERFVKQLIDESFSRELIEVKAERERAVIHLRLSRPQKNHKQNIYLYCEKKNDVWLVVGINTSKDHPAYFLSGKVPGYLQLELLPASDVLVERGNIILGVAEKLQALTKKGDPFLLDAEVAAPILKGVLNGDPMVIQKHLWQLLQLQSVKVTATYHLAALNRGVIKFEGVSSGVNVKGEPYTSPDDTYIYVKDLDSAWTIYDAGGLGLTSVLLKE